MRQFHRAPHHMFPYVSHSLPAIDVDMFINIALHVIGVRLIQGKGLLRAYHSSMIIILMIWG